ncbi:hypothetical protein F5B21DRAFT_491272 [Xylaria acuta]|nr:hypothetical protein F5B21DRAFT_491272 [Xylaria acuta]
MSAFRTTTTTTSKDPVPALLTIFTPAPECSSLYVHFCDKGGCSAFLGLDKGAQPCIPGYTPSGYGVPIEVTYSPGLFCPLGMTTASRLYSLSAVYCCYSGFRINSPYGCTAHITEGTFIVTNSTPGGQPSTFAFGPTQTDSLNSIASHFGGSVYTGRPTIFARAPAIFLAGHRLAVSPGPFSTAPTSLPSTPSRSPESGGPKSMPNGSKTLQVGIAVGLSLGGVLLLCLGLFLFTVYRKRLKRRKRARVETEEKKQQHHEEYRGKPELEGSAGDPLRLVKVELDALATRAELEGTAGDEAGTGINVMKPELQGSLGRQSLLGVYVKKKAELEASAAVHETVNSAKSLTSSQVQSQSTSMEITQLAELDSQDWYNRNDVENRKSST